METIFTVHNEDLERLNPQEAVDFFRKLLWSEANACGIGKNLINVPSGIYAADGGIDADARNMEVNAGQGIIKQGLNRYQVKTGNFSLSDDRHVKEILFKEGFTELKPRIKSCLDEDGTFHVVLFGWDNPQREDNQLVNKFKEKLVSIDRKYSNAKIEIYQQNNIISFLEPYPSLVLELKGISDLPFLTHKSWSQNGDMKKDLVRSPDYDQKMESIREILRSTDQAKHIRIIGEAGVGKTRFILEATSAEDIAPLVVYTKADAFIRSALLTYICREDNPFHIIAIVDECSQQQRIGLWNLLKHRGSRIKLITIYNEKERREYGIDYPEVPQLSIDEVKRIILSYGVSQDHVDRWAGLAGDSPRFAHMIGTNLKYYPDDILRPVEGIYDRIIAGYEDPNSEEVKRQRRVIRHIALFKRFGYKRPFEEEARAIAEIVRKADRNITWAKFQEIVEKFKSQNILQGENTLYITPRALHIRMWTEWCDTYGGSFSIDEFLKDVPENLQLRDWFYEMFEYARESMVASDIVERLLGENGPFFK